MMRSVLVAGMHDESNQYTRFCDDLWLSWEHLPEIRAGHVPTKFDGAIVAAAIASHSLYQSVKSAYGQLGKPIFLSKVGISEIKEDFLIAVFGNAETLRILSERSDFQNRAQVMSISTRMWWVLANFLKVGDSFKLKDLMRFFEKNLITGEEKAIQQGWYRGRAEGNLTEISPGSSTFNGIPHRAYEIIKGYGLTCPEENVIMEAKAKGPFKAKPVIQYEENVFEMKKETDHSASIDLLLEAITRSQDEVRALKEMIEKTVPEIIKTEMRGISTMLGSLVPKLNGLAPDQIEKVDQMLDLFLSMRAR
jgi:hypothetical protein